MTDLYIPRHSYPAHECPLCFAAAKTVAYEYRVENLTLPMYSCETCRGLFIRPMPIEQMNNRKMDSLGDAELISPVFKMLHEKLILEKEERTIRSIIRKSKIDLLDIGCGSGWSSDFWRSRGFSVEAVEPSPTRCEFARKTYGLTVHNCYVEELDLSKQYDVIVLRHIIEHLEFPGKILKTVRNLLRPEGLLLLVVPNLDCIGRFLFGRHWEWVLPWHCNFFTPDALNSLVQQRGFTAIATYQSPSPFYYAESLARTVHSRTLEKFFFTHRLACLPVALPLAAIGFCTGKADNLTLIGHRNDSGKSTGNSA